MRGHIAKKGKTYYAIIYEGINPATGKSRHRWHRAGSTKKEAERVLADLVKRHHDGDYRAPEKITLGVYLLERWLPARKTQLGETTFSSYRRNLELHVVPYLGSVPLQRLAPEDLDTLYAQLLTNGRRNLGGGALSPKTVRNVHAILRKALADAQRKGTVARNVAELADPPKFSRRARPNMQVWNADELRRFLQAIETHDLYIAFYVKANTGMRRGEVLGLTWKNIDFERARLSVTQAVTAPDYQKKVSEVKTAHSRRTIDLDPRTLGLLRAWRKRQLERHLQSGIRSDDSSFVFAQHDGQPLHPDFFSQTFERLLSKMDVPRIRLHDLRVRHEALCTRRGERTRLRAVAAAR